jgi:hypothetical protein
MSGISSLGTRKHSGNLGPQIRCQDCVYCWVMGWLDSHLSLSDLPGLGFPIWKDSSQGIAMEMQ